MTENNEDPRRGTGPTSSSTLELLSFFERERSDSTRAGQLEQAGRAPKGSDRLGASFFVVAGDPVEALYQR